MNNTESTAKTIVDSGMLYNLDAEFLDFQFRLRHDKLSSPLVIDVRMKPYDNRDMILMLRERTGMMQAAKDEMDAWDIKEGKPTAAHDLFEKYNVQVKAMGKVLTEAQIAQLDARYGIKDIVVDQGYNGITRCIPEYEVEEDKLDIDALLGDASINLSFSLVDPKDGIEKSIIIPQNFTPPSAMDSINWNRAQRQQGLRQGAMRVIYDHESLNTLYNKLIRDSYQDNKGMVLEGSIPCVADNKEDWKNKVPYLIKRAGLSFLFSRAERAVRGNG
jgi:hypothetical protein